MAAIRATRRAVTRTTAATTPSAQTPTPPLSIEDIAQRILIVRGRRVLLDTDLAAFYGETTKRFNEQVKRNLGRFPADFMFQLNDAEFANLRSQFATSSLPGTGHGGRRYAPLAFTEHGAIQAATILNSARATEISVHVVRAFIELRNLVAGNKDLAAKMKRIEHQLDSHDQAISGLIESVRHLLAPPEPKKRPIGFVIHEERKK